MLLQPQPLAKHFLHGLAHRVGVVAGDRLDFRPGLAQPGLERVGGVQQLGDGALARERAAPAERECRAGGQASNSRTMVSFTRDSQGLLPKSAPIPARAANALPGQGLGFDIDRAGPSISRLMSTEIPEVLDAWRSVAARHRIEGRVPLASLPRLRDGLFDPDGEVRFALDFDRDALQLPCVVLEAEAELPLQCQRSLQRFLYPVKIEQRLGLIRTRPTKPRCRKATRPCWFPRMAACIRWTWSRTS